MKRMILLMMLVLLLTGCAGGPTFEQLQDVYVPGEVPVAKRVTLTLPADAAAQTLAGSTGSLYFCDGYEIAVETLASGDVERTFRSVTGHSSENLTCFMTEDGGYDRYECVWISAGEGSDRICRAVILDDGNYHYCVTVMANAADAGALQESWQALFGSIVLG